MPSPSMRGLALHRVVLPPRLRGPRRPFPLVSGQEGAVRGCGCGAPQLRGDAAGAALQPGGAAQKRFQPGWWPRLRWQTSK